MGLFGKSHDRDPKEQVIYICRTNQRRKSNAIDFHNQFALLRKDVYFSSVHSMTNS